MKYWFDTEFIERGPRDPIYLLSIGIVAEDGREFYAVVSDAPKEKASDWVKSNVLPHLLPTDGTEYFYCPLASLGLQIKEFIGEGTKPEFWGYYADYDWVVFCQIFGAMVDLPKGWPMYCRDIKQWCDQLGNPKLPEQTSAEHHALMDARWNREAWKFLDKKAALVHG